MYMFREWNVAYQAAIAGVLLALAYGAVNLSARPSRGIPVLIARTDCESGDGREFHIRLLQNGRVRLNGKEMDTASIENSLNETLGQMAERVLFVQADRGVSTQTFVSFVAQEEAELNPLYVAVVTDAMEDEGKIGRTICIMSSAVQH